jgi:hypothetical protein
MDAVVPRPARQGVIPTVAVDRIIAVTAKDLIWSDSSIRCVVSNVPVNATGKAVGCIGINAQVEDQPEQRGQSVRRVEIDPAIHRKGDDRFREQPRKQRRPTFAQIGDFPCDAPRRDKCRQPRIIWLQHPARVRELTADIRATVKQRQVDVAPQLQGCNHRQLLSDACHGLTIGR